MVQPYIDQIKTFIEDFKSLNLESFISNQFPDITDLKNLHFSKFSAAEFITLSRQFFEQLENEIDNGNGLILPLYFSNPEYGQSDLAGQINSFLSNVKSNQVNNAETILLWLVTYQLQNGFYNKSQYKLHPVNVNEIKKSQVLIDLETESLQNLRSSYQAFIESLEYEKNQLNIFKAQKENELSQITSNLETSNSHTNTIQNLLNTASQAHVRIESILAEVTKQNTKVQETALDMEKSVTKAKTDFSTLLNSLTETETKYLNLYSDFEEKLEIVENKYKYFVERNNYLDELIGREVGASLFETFKQRKTELSQPLQYWRLAIFSMTIVTVVGIFAIFTNFFGLASSSHPGILDWQMIVINTIKSSPFIFLLYYTVSQYNKERNFQEEYAFKSAVALTINAYANVLVDTKAKDELILKA
ncbi:MAG: hypothetical protein V4619_16410, partial [Bacteroidota bacterium]